MDPTNVFPGKVEAPANLHSVKQLPGPGTPRLWVVYGHVLWGDMVTFEHIELNDYGSIELVGSVVVP